MVKTPELDKMVKVRDDSQKIGEFLEWLSGEDIVLASWFDDDNLGVIRGTKEQLLAKYFCIDLAKCEKERQAILEELRAAKS